MMTEIQDLEGVQKRCPPEEDQHLKKCKKHLFFVQKWSLQKLVQTI